MSFQDPDDRQRWQDQANREAATAAAKAANAFSVDAIAEGVAIATARRELDDAIRGARDAAVANEAAQARFNQALGAYCRLVAPPPGQGG